LETVVNEQTLKKLPEAGTTARRKQTKWQH